MLTVECEGIVTHVNAERRRLWATAHVFHSFWKSEGWGGSKNIHALAKHAEV